MAPSLKQAVESAFGKSVSMPIFPQHYEPEAKFNIGPRLKQFRHIRRMLADDEFGLKTQVIPETINNRNDAMLNLIVEPFFENDPFSPFFERHGKFLRIAGRVDDDGNLYDIKIALKCLSSHVQIIDDLPYRQEFEPRLPKELRSIDKLPEALEWFWQEYERVYEGDKTFSHITADHLRPTSAYITNRTGYHFLKELPKKGMLLECEGCEDLFLCLGPDLETPLSDFRNMEGQFEWEVLGAYMKDDAKKPSKKSRREVGLSTMRKMLKKIIKTMKPNSEWRDFTTTDSKAEISRKMTFEHTSFMCPYTQDNSESGLSLKFTGDTVKHRYVLNNSSSVMEVLGRRSVKNSLQRFAYHLVKQAREYNSRMRDDLKTEFDVPKVA